MSQETTNDIRHTISINNKAANCIIKIRLNDECKNGHEDFSMTADFWEIGHVRCDRNSTVGGCCHDDILKVAPELEIFETLHLCDFNGTPMYAHANLLYHIREGKLSHQHLIDSYNLGVSLEDFEKHFVTCEDEMVLKFLFVKFGVLKRWKKTAEEGIAWLEENTGKKFKSTGARPRKEHIISVRDYIDIKKKLEEGYYSEANIKLRKLEKHNISVQKKLTNLRADITSKIIAMELDYAMRCCLIQMGCSEFSCIHYTHTNEIVANWSTNKISKDDFELVEKTLKEFEMDKRKPFSETKFTFKNN